MPSKKSEQILVIIDNRVGNANQAIALANSLGVDYDIIEVEYNYFAKFPNYLLTLWPLHVKKSVINKLTSVGEPSIIISAGRRTAALAVYLKKIYQHKPKLIQIMRPNIDPRAFEMIILPQHDKFHKVLPNIVRTIGSLNDVKKRLDDVLPQLKLSYPEIRSFIAVIVGGSSKGYNFTEQDAKSLLDVIVRVSENHSLPLFVTFSRRTPEAIKNIFKEKLSWPNIIYDPNDGGKNPYPAIIGAAEYIITTTDSISMCSEAASTGKPIYTFCPDSFKLQKHRFFLQQLIDLGIVKRLDAATDYLEKYDYEPLDEITKVSKLIKEKLMH